MCNAIRHRHHRPLPLAQVMRFHGCIQCFHGFGCIKQRCASDNFLRITRCFLYKNRAHNRGELPCPGFKFTFNEVFALFDVGIKPIGFGDGSWFRENVRQRIAHVWLSLSVNSYPAFYFHLLRLPTRHQTKFRFCLHPPVLKRLPAHVS